MCVTDSGLLHQVLSGLRFPVRRWQSVAQGLSYGVDADTCACLARLPFAAYASVEQVAAELGAPRDASAPGVPAQRTESGGVAARAR